MRFASVLQKCFVYLSILPNNDGILNTQCLWTLIVLEVEIDSIYEINIITITNVRYKHAFNDKNIKNEFHILFWNNPNDLEDTFKNI